MDYDIAVVPTISLFESFLRPDPRAGFDLADPVLEGTLPDFLLSNMRSSAYMEEERRRFSEASHMDAYAWARSRIPVFRVNIIKMHEAGVKIAVGTDGGGTVGYNFQEYNTPWKLKILVESGITPLEAIVQSREMARKSSASSMRWGPSSPVNSPTFSFSRRTRWPT